MEHHFIHSEMIIIELLLLATVVAWLANFLRIPYTVALVVAGLLITYQTEVDFEVTSDLIMGLFIPPLVFEAAFHIELRVLKENLTTILILAVPGVILSTLIVGGVVSYGSDISLGEAIVFGSLISATDPVAVVSLFRTLGVSHRLATIIEGESLLNDGTAIVVFNLALLACMSGKFDPISGIIGFLKVSLLGALIGAVLGWIGAKAIARLDDYFIEITITTVIAYGSYLCAEYFHVSGVLSVVAAGILSGNYGPRGMSPTTKIVLFNFWEYAAFLANSFVFLFIGLKINITNLIENINAIILAVIAILVSRAIVCYVLSWFIPRIGGYLPGSWRHVLFWGGLRGAISLALALTLPSKLPHQSALQTMAFGVVLFTLLCQGTTIKLLLNKLGLSDKPKRKIARETKWGKLFALRAGHQRLKELHKEGVFSEELWGAISIEYEEAEKALSKDVVKVFSDYPELEREIMLQARREALRAERSALSEALRRGLLSDEVYKELLEETDSRLEALTVIETEDL